MADKWSDVTHLAYCVRNPSNLAGMHTMGIPIFWKKWGHFIYVTMFNIWYPSRPEGPYGSMFFPASSNEPNSRQDAKLFELLTILELFVVFLLNNG